MQKYIFQRSLLHFNKFLATNNNVYKGIYVRKSLDTFNVYIRFYSDVVSKKKTSTTNINDLITFIKNKNTFYLKLLTNIHDTVDYSEINAEDVQLLLNCCGQSLADSSKTTRNEACQKIFEEVLKKNNLNLNIYHTYIDVCTENCVKLNIKQFLSNMKYEPTQKTFKLLLKNISEQGDVQQVYEILEIMKSKAVQVDEDIFNDVVLAHTINGGLKSSETVLKTMRTAQIPETLCTKYALFKGIIKRGIEEDLNIFLQQFNIKLNEVQLLDIIIELGLNDNVSWLSEIKSLYSELALTRDFMILLKQRCVHLVHMDKPEAAWDIFQYFIKPVDDSQDDYGFFLLREMLFCQINVDKIISIGKYLKENQLNQLALEKLVDICLRHKFVNEAWELLESLPELRPHFFWPLLIEASNRQGEGGVFKTISKMKSLGVQIDSETLRHFILPFCNLDDSNNIINKLKNQGFTMKELIEPLIIVLLQNGKVFKVIELFNNYNVDSVGSEWIKLLPFSWYSTKDVKNVVTVLQKVCEVNSSHNIVGVFLTKCLGLCKEADDFKNYIELLEAVKDSRLRIDPTTANSLRSISNNGSNQEICDKIDALIDFGLKSESSYIPHPRDMNLEELECHLIELKTKQMNTRGTLRLLIMQYLNHGNLDKVKELRQEFLNQGYEETIGMKATLMNSFTTRGNLEPALDIYKEISLLYPEFKLDIFKVIDLCTLLVKENKYEIAMELLQNECKSRKITPRKEILRNCLELLNAFRNETNQIEMFNFLVDKGLCSINNVTLGPLVRIHLINENYEKAIDTYINFTKEYKSTPLQLEMFKAIVKQDNPSYLQKLVNSTKKVYGNASTQVTLIAALAENGMDTLLKKILLNLKYSIQRAMEKRCERWVLEQKIQPLLTLLNSCLNVKLSSEIFDFVYAAKCVMKIYTVSNDCESAIRFYQSCQEHDIFDKELENELQKLLKNNKYEVNKCAQV